MGVVRPARLIAGLKYWPCYVCLADSVVANTAVSRLDFIPVGIFSTFRTSSHASGSSRSLYTAAGRAGWPHYGLILTYVPHTPPSPTYRVLGTTIKKNKSSPGKYSYIHYICLTVTFFREKREYHIPGTRKQGEKSTARKTNQTPQKNRVARRRRQAQGALLTNLDLHESLSVLGLRANSVVCSSESDSDPLEQTRRGSDVILSPRCQPPDRRLVTRQN